MAYHQEKNSEGNLHFDAVLYRDREWKPHFHQNCEWILVLKGSLRTTVGGREVTLTEDECALILPGQIHAYVPSEEGTRYYVAVFSADHVPELIPETAGKQASRPAFRLSGCVKALIAEELLRKEPSPLMRRSCLCAVCSEYLRKVPLEPREEKTDFLAGSVLEYIAAHFTEDISLKSCAAELGYEYHYLSRILEKEYRLNFRGLLNRQRLDRAAELLLKPELSVAGAAYASGFQSVRSFNEHFLRQTGLTPLQWRKLKKKA